MPQTAQIPTILLITPTGGENYNITSKYYEAPPSTIMAFISDLISTLNLTSFVENELIITVSNIGLIYYYIDTNGNLIVVSVDSANYEIDINGELIYNIP